MLADDVQSAARGEPSKEESTPAQLDGTQHDPTRALRDALLRLERELSDANEQAVPADDPSLSVGSALRRSVKKRQFRWTRPVSRRSDRVSRELAGVAAGLADRLVSMEAEVRRLQGAMADLRASRGQGGETRVGVAPTDLDAYYWEFERAMRGTPEEIRHKLAAHAGRAAELRSTSAEDHPVWIDVGCGAGEFCSLVQEWGFAVFGVDASPIAVQHARKAGFDVALADGGEYLADYRGPAPLAISAMQLIEHVSKDRWLSLFEQAWAVLAPGGALLVETINPLSLASLSSSFFADITHTWPTHPEVARLMATHAGFERTEVVFLNHDHKGEAQDFALWAFKQRS